MTEPAESAPARDRLSLCPSPSELLALIGDPDPSLSSMLAWCMYASGMRQGKDGRWRTSWVRGRHLVLLAQKLVALYRGEIRRLAVSMPPRQGKSRMVSQLAPGWWLGRDPRARIVVCSYSQEQANQQSVQARDAMATYGREAFGLDVNLRAAVHRWSLYREGRKTGGGLRAVGVGGGITGGDVDLFVLDDMYKGPEDSGHPGIRRGRLDWIESVVNTRLEPWSKALFMGTRWHQEDHIGWLRENRDKLGVPWEFLILPAICEEEGDPLGRAVGDVLWPERLGRDYYEEQRKNVSIRGPYVWDALYQCRPTSKEGGLFKKKWLRPYKVVGDVLVSGDLRVPRDRLRVFSTVDLAGSKRERADWTVIDTFGIDIETKTLWLLDVVRGQLEAPQIIAAMRDVQRRMKPVSFYVERAAPQLNLIHKLRFAEQAGASLDPSDDTQDVLLSRAISEGLPVIRLDPGSTDKVTRSAPAQAVMASSRLLTPESASAPWLPPLVAELLSFPDGGAKDDQVDALSYGVQVFLEVLAATAHAAATTRDPGTLPVGGRLRV